MTPDLFLSTFLLPGLTWLESLLGATPPNSPEAQLSLLAWAGQETQWSNVAQIGGGPGRGPWQDEPETCLDVLTNPTTEHMALRVCVTLGVGAVGKAVWTNIIPKPLLSVAFSRLDLYADPEPLAAVGDAHGCLEAYKRIWGPAWVEDGGQVATEATNRFLITVYPESLTAFRAQAT